MLNLTIDAGNSHIKAVLFDDDRLVQDWRFEDPSCWSTQLIGALDGRMVDAVGAASVRRAEDEISRLTARISEAPTFFVSAEVPLPFQIAYQTPETLGPDRLAAAAAAWHRFGGDGAPVVSIGLGTAITSEIVDGTGRFIGGSIAPGPRLQYEALHQGTARLPLVQPRTDPPAIGYSTTTAIESGVWYAIVDSVEGRLRRVEHELGGNAHVVLTGGWASAVSNAIRTPHIVDPHLVHRGILQLMNGR